MSILTRGFWRSYWIALRRARKDKRARSISLRITFGLTYLLAYILFLVFMFLVFMGVNAAAGQGVWNAVFYTFMLGAGTIAAILMRRWHRKQDELLNTSLTGRAPLHPQDFADASPEVRSYLEARALITASLLARGASEIYLEHHQIAEGAEVVTRQVHNSLLRGTGLWDKLERPEADLASAADGLWSVEQKNNVLTWCEQLRVLRWVFGIDSELAPLAHFPTLDFSLSQEVLRKGRPLSSKPLLKPWDVRVQRDTAREYTARVVAELKARRLIAGGPELDGWADELRAKSMGDSTDYLAGARTIGELDDNSLRRLGAFASIRERYSAYLVEVLNVTQPFSFSNWTH